MVKTILTYNTTEKSQVRTITADLKECLAKSGVDNGTLIAYSLHTTLGLILQETAETNLCGDFLDFLTRLVEDDGHTYQHTCALHPSGACLDDRFNGPSHVRHLITNQTIVLDVQGRQMTLGQWQDVALLELDGPREGRRILVKVIAD